MKNCVKKDNMKPAYIDQMLMWTLIFVSFVWLFFFVLNYSTAVRLNENMDYMSKFAAKYIANNIPNQNTVTTNVDLFANLNDIKLSKIATITNANLSCVIATAAPQNANSQCIFITQGTYNKGFLSGQGANNLVSKAVVYNTTNAAQITCTLNITIN